MTPSPFLSDSAPVCPPALLQAAAERGQVRVALAGAGAELPMTAARDATEAGIITPVFVGNPDQIALEAKALGWDISGFRVEPTSDEVSAAQTAAAICGAGEADVLMKGNVHTDQFIRAVLTRDNGLRTDARLVHVFYISPPDGGRAIAISDAAVNVAPNIATRQDGMGALITVLRATGVDTPRIAILSATESEIASVPSSIEAGELRDWGRSEWPDVPISGPLAFDLILSPEAAATKGMADDPVAGYADGVLVPDIVSGNTLFKSLVYLGGGCAAGVVLGAKVPVLLTSRADPPAARLASIALASVLSQS